MPQLLCMTPSVLGCQLQLRLHLQRWPSMASHSTKPHLFFCCASEVLVIPQNTRRNQSDATHSRVFILFELARACAAVMQDGFGGGGAPNVYQGKVL